MSNIEINKELGLLRVARFVRQNNVQALTDEYKGLERSFSASKAEAHGAVIAVATGLTYALTHSLDTAAMVSAALTVADTLLKVPDYRRKLKIPGLIEGQLNELQVTETSIATLEGGRSGIDAVTEKITERLAALDQIERVKVQEAAEKNTREVELNKCESKFDEVITSNALGNSSWNLDRFSLSGNTRSEWTSLLRAKGYSEIEIVRHQLGRYKQLEAANKVQRDMKIITVMVDSLQAQLTALELVESRHKTS